MVSLALGFFAREPRLTNITVSNTQLCAFSFHKSSKLMLQ